MKKRSGQRGAMFVEALIVISVFVLFFMAMVYFRDFYRKQIHVGRLARASAIAYSMGACEAKDPTAWVSRDLEAGTNHTANRTQAQSPKTCRDTSPECQARQTRQQSTQVGSGEDEQDGQSIVSALPGAGNDDSMLNPIGHLGLSTEARSGNRPGKGFRGRASSTSYVSCGDKIASEDVGDKRMYGKLIDVATKPFKKPSL